MQRTVLAVLVVLTACTGADDPTFEGDPTPTTITDDASTVSVALSGDVEIAFSGPAACDETVDRLYLDADREEASALVQQGEIDGEPVTTVTFVVSGSGDAEMQALHGNVTTLFTGRLLRDSDAEGWGSAGNLTGELAADDGTSATATVSYVCV